MNSQIAKKIKLVERIKSVISNKSNDVISRYPNLSRISNSVARKIQIAHINLHKNKAPESFSPIHRSIIEQLEIDNEQIRHGAVYNLIQIAKNHSDDRKEIVRELKIYSKKNDDDFPSVKLAKAYIEEYRNNRSAK